MQDIFDLYNPNADIFEIEQEEGGAEDDNYYGSIGDAVQKHIGQLSQSQRMVWEDLYYAVDGSIFRVVPNWHVEDDDPFNLRGKKLDEYFLQLIEKGVPEEKLENVREAMIVEQERREKSEDIMDCGEAIPYHEWEKFPQMWAHYEIPSTPRDRYVYMGNSRELYYDYIVELPQLNYSLIEDKEHIINILQKKDIANSIRYRQKSESLKEKDGMLQLIYKNWSEWDLRYKRGEHVFAEILKFGQTLFANFKNAMNKYHWHLYRRIKDKYAPAVLIGSIDINRCKLNELASVFNMSREKAKDIWLARPFRNLAEVYNSGLIGSDNFSFSENGDKIINYLENNYNTSLVKRNAANYYAAGHQLTRMELENTADLEKTEWKQLWAFFNVLKQQLIREIQ